MSTISSDYYSILELSRDATQEDIKEAYRNLSLRFHQSKATDSLKDIYAFKFNQIAEAYTVLSNPNLKGIYDIYGKEILYKGIRDPKNGDIKGSYKYPFNADEVFQKFMNETNPFALIRENERMDDDYGSIFSNAYGGRNQPKPKELEPIKINLFCTLEESYNGCIKDLTYKKSALNIDKRTSTIVEKTIKIEVFPGMNEGNIITFIGQGNEAPGLKSSDLIVTIKLSPHEHFKRINENDLLYTATVSLKEALSSTPVQINTLDGRYISVFIDEIISPESVKIVKGEGMPVYNRETHPEEYVLNRTKGDLFIRFNIIFPEYINGKKKEKIVKLLTEE